MYHSIYDFPLALLLTKLPVYVKFWHTEILSHDTVYIMRKYNTSVADCSSLCKKITLAEHINEQNLLFQKT